MTTKWTNRNDGNTETATNDNHDYCDGQLLCMWNMAEVYRCWLLVACANITAFV